jgi:hypothetical protein
MSTGIGRQNIITLFWKSGSCTVLFLGIHKLEPDIYIGFAQALHLHFWYIISKLPDRFTPGKMITYIQEYYQIPDDSLN